LAIIYVLLAFGRSNATYRGVAAILAFLVLAEHSRLEEVGGEAEALGGCPGGSGL
jgi:hypothetical protein